MDNNRTTPQIVSIVMVDCLSFPGQLIAWLLRPGAEHDYSSMHEQGAETRTLQNNRVITTRVYGKRQTPDSRLRFLKINNKYTRILQNNSRIQMADTKLLTFTRQRANEAPTRLPHGNHVNQLISAA